jgi:bifunctional non-homologous end joining protein LigD
MPAAIHPMKVKEKSSVASYVSLEDVAGLVALVQFGVLEIHPWGAAPANPDRADRITIDLDPDPAVDWRQMIDAAGEVRHRLEALGLRSFLKTTGGKGLHVVAPLSPPVEWRVAKAFAKMLADRMVLDNPERYIATASKAARKGKIFVDYLRNQRGATAVAPYSTRARPGATVSMPIEWTDLAPRLRSDRFDLRNVEEHIKRRKRDPWREFAKLRQTIEI